MIDYLMNWSLSNHGIVTLLIIAAMILLASFISDHYDKSKLTFIMQAVAIGIAMIPMLALIIDAQTTPTVTFTEWRTVYTNDIGAKVSLHISTGNPFNPGGDFTAGQDLGSNYYQFERGYGYVAVVATKNGTKVEKDVSLSDEDIIINGQLSKYSKIEKIEYREVTTKYEHHVKTSNEMRVTIDGTKTTGDKEELEQLFK